MYTGDPDATLMIHMVSASTFLQLLARHVQASENVFHVGAAGDQARAFRCHFEKRAFAGLVDRNHVFQIDDALAARRACSGSLPIFA